MGKITTFNFTTLNGYYKGPQGEISWHKHEKEESEFSQEGLSKKNILLFGRMTYQMMAGFWPTAAGMANDPIVAKGMNEAEKIVFSRTLKNADWNNTSLIKENMLDEIRKLKKTSAKDMTILGSGSIVAALAEEGLIDEYQIMIDPVALGDGGTLFSGLKKQLDLKLVNTRVFKSGVVLLCYQPK